MEPIRQFFKQDYAAGLLLAAAAALALIMANTPLAGFYDRLLHTNVSILFGDAGLSKSLLHWINDGLMALFFFLVGLEIKRELVAGHLSTRAQALLPVLAAIGGMAVPALVFFIVNRDAPQNLHGWAIPSATDIAFALGVLSLLGPRVPAALKILLLAIAVMDDLGAIVIIALFYTATLSTTALLLAAVFLAVLAALNRAGVRRIAPYTVAGFFLWLCVLESGVHATLAGVAAALFIPVNATGLSERLEHALRPWVVFGIMPVFAFANAGVSFAGFSPADILAPLPAGIILGLFLGKQLGIFTTVYAAVKTGICRMPDHVTWRQIHAVSLLCGIGFTMSLFIGTLAFADPSFAAPVRMGVLGGSLLSATLGYLALRATLQPKD